MWKRTEKDAENCIEILWKLRWHSNVVVEFMHCNTTKRGGHFSAINEIFNYFVVTIPSVISHENPFELHIYIPEASMKEFTLLYPIINGKHRRIRCNDKIL